MKAMKSRRSDRGGIGKRGPIRTDRDGDMDMDASGARGRRGRGGPGRSAAPRTAASSRPQTRPKNVDLFEKAIRSNNDTQANIRSGKNARAGNDRNPSSLESFSVFGLKEANIPASSRDGGLSSLITFLERRMNVYKKSGARAKITKSRIEGDIAVVSVKPEFAQYILRVSGNTFAGTNVKIEAFDSSSTASLDHALSTTGNGPKSTEDTKAMMTAILARRYDASRKLLDLSSLGTDPDLRAMGIFDSVSTGSKFFPALMKVWEMGFTDATQKREAVESVTLANNQLPSIANVTTLAPTFPGLKNLDLSNNNISEIRSIIGWRWKFRGLEFLDLTNNPIKTDETFRDTMMKWYPKLQTLNNVQVRTAEEVAAQKKTPIPVQPPFFKDESQIAENFIRAFFPGYDNDRNEILNTFYDETSTFSMNVNATAPKATEADTPHWDSYMKKSRNLLKLDHLTARMSRSLIGKENIRQCWNDLPPTSHPDMTARPEEYLIECFPVPGLPDPTGQSETGVGGLMVMTHGKFEEKIGAKIETRSFDRTFVLGPGAGGGIRVLNDALTLRAYGGHDAWSPDSTAIPQAIAPPAAVAPGVPAPSVLAPGAPAPAQPAAPEGYGLPGPGKTDEQVQQEQMVTQLSEKSGMTLQFSEMALSSNGWNLESAWTNFEQLKAQGQLPADAFRAGV